MERSRKRAGRAVNERPPAFRGWLSTDEDEVRRREWRGRSEIDEVSALDPEHRPFGDHSVASSSGGRYVVEIRSLRQRINSCECHDYRTNHLGTCKHIEGVLRRPDGVRAGGAVSGRSSGRIEVFFDERNGRTPRLTLPKGNGDGAPEVATAAGRLFRSLRRGSPKALDGLRRMARDRPGALRVSRLLESWVEARQASERKRRERVRLAADLGEGRRSLDFLKRPLLPYQVEGVLHLAFGERALLADDMGLGKTVQAIAACAPAVEAARLTAGCLTVAEGEPEPEGAEAVAAFLLEHEAAAGGLPLDAIGVLSGEAPEAGAVAPVRSLLETVDARLDSVTD